MKSYGRHSMIPDCNPLTTVGRLSETIVRQRVTRQWQDSEPIERMGLRKSPPKPAELRLLTCEGKKIGIGRRTWRSQKSKAPRTRLDSKKSAKSYETDCKNIACA